RYVSTRRRLVLSSSPTSHQGPKDCRPSSPWPTDANELVAEIHDRMPLIVAPGDYARWLSDEPDPRDLMRPFPSEPMRMWPISTRVNKPENYDPSIVEP